MVLEPFSIVDVGVKDKDTLTVQTNTPEAETVIDKKIKETVHTKA